MSHIRAFLNQVSENNSTTAPLGIGGVFTGAADKISDLAFVSVLVTVYAVQASAEDGLKVQFSRDGSDWHDSDEYSIGAGSYKTYTFQPVDQYFRIVYTNGGVAHGAGDFHITTQFHSVAPKPSSHRLEDNLSGQDDATLQKSIVAARAPDGTYQNINADAVGALNVAFGDTANLDAFSRQRVSNPDTVFDSTFQYDLQPLIFEEITANGGAVTHVPDEAAAELSLDGTADGEASLQTYQYVPYIPGKSHVLYQTFVMKTAVADVVKRAGLFDHEDGVFFQQAGDGTLSVVRRTSTSGSVVETVIAQDNWNIDSMDGTGTSNLTLDITKGQIFAMDLQWLGMGRVRCGFDIDGRFWPVHQFLNANNLALVYMKRGTLPVRWELSGDTVATFDAVCASVQSEGGGDRHFTYQFSSASAARTAPNGSREPLVAIRAGTTFNGLENRISTRILNINTMQTSSGLVLFELLYVPVVADITGGSWASPFTYAGCQANVTATAVANAIVVASWFSQSTNQQKMVASGTVDARYPLAVDAAGTTPRGAWVLAATGIGGAETVYGALDWEEIR